jgi:hypothetical protein
VACSRENLTFTFTYAEPRTWTENKYRILENTVMTEEDQTKLQPVGRRHVWNSKSVQPRPQVNTLTPSVSSKVGAHTCLKKLPWITDKDQSKVLLLLTFRSSYTIRYVHRAGKVAWSPAGEVQLYMNTKCSLHTTDIRHEQTTDIRLLKLNILT